MLNALNPQDSGARIVRLETHAAVRLSELSDENYDCYDLPLDKHKGSTHRGSSFGKKMKTLASYLTVRINPAFQECHVVVVESMKGLALEVRSVSPAKGPNAANADRLVYTAPLATLLDVSTDSVIEKDNVVFTQLPDSFSPRLENGSVLKPVLKEKKTPKKGEIISTLFSAYGDIGLTLTFKAPRVGASSAKPLTKVVLRFVSSTERDTWMSFCMEAYVGLLLDSIRSGEERICPPAVVGEAVKAAMAGERDGKATAATPPAASGEVKPPPRDAVERYIDFFLSSSGKAGGGTGDARSDDRDGGDWDSANAEGEPPGNGLLKVAECGSQEGTNLRRLSRARRTVRDGDSGFVGIGENGITQVVECLLIQKAKASQRLKKGTPTELWIPLDSFTVYAEDAQQGESFYLELHSPPLRQAGDIKDVGDNHSHSVSPPSPLTSPADGGSFAKSAAGGGTGLLSTVTLQLTAENHLARKRWLKWFSVALGKQVLFLHQARQMAEAEKAQAAKSKTRFLGRDSDW